MGQSGAGGEHAHRVGGSIGILGKENVSERARWIWNVGSCGFDGGLFGQGGIREEARTLAVKAGVSFANPDMMTVIAVTMYACIVCFSLWEVYFGDITESCSAASNVGCTLPYVCRWRLLCIHCTSTSTSTSTVHLGAG
jgi:hypothetical protein